MDVKERLNEFFDAKGPTIMEISQLLDDPVIPKVMSKTDKNGKMLSPALHDMYPFISDEELNELMISGRN